MSAKDTLQLMNITGLSFNFRIRYKCFNNINFNLLLCNVIQLMF